MKHPGAGVGAKLADLRGCSAHASCGTHVLRGLPCPTEVAAAILVDELLLLTGGCGTTLCATALSSCGTLREHYRILHGTLPKSRKTSMFYKSAKV